MPIELAALQQAEFDLGRLGFSRDEFSKLLSGDLQVDHYGPDEVSEPPDEAIIQSGDLWILGDHRLFCGDNSNPAHVDRLLDGAPIQLVNTDLPQQSWSPSTRYSTSSSTSSSQSLISSPDTTPKIALSNGSLD